MKKYVKWLLGVAAIGSSIGLIITHFCRKSKKNSTEEAVSMEEEDFDLDSDLKPSSERGYVSLNKTQETTAEEEAADSSEADSSIAEATEEPLAEVAEEDTAKAEHPEDAETADTPAEKETVSEE